MSEVSFGTWYWVQGVSACFWERNVLGPNSEVSGNHGQAYICQCPTQEYRGRAVKVYASTFYDFITSSNIDLFQNSFTGVLG